jgi:alkylated DNA repair dioxygenase AlkB
MGDDSIDEVMICVSQKHAELEAYIKKYDTSTITERDPIEIFNICGLLGIYIDLIAEILKDENHANHRELSKGEIEMLGTIDSSVKKLKGDAVHDVVVNSLISKLEDILPKHMISNKTDKDDNKKDILRIHPFFKPSIIKYISPKDLLFIETLKSKGATIKFISNQSWIAMIKNYWKPNKEEFLKTWNEHPIDYKSIQIGGKFVKLPRWQQAYGISYKYSGITSEAVEPTGLIIEMMKKLNELMNTIYQFNMCLCNWYAPEHYIGPHSDDVRQLVPGSPIGSISWGCTRTFVLTPINKETENSKLSIQLQDGDFILMGGNCQQSHKHEILKLKSGDDQKNRINFTFRCFNN